MFNKQYKWYGWVVVLFGIVNNRWNENVFDPKNWYNYTYTWVIELRKIASNRYFLSRLKGKEQAHSPSPSILLSFILIYLRCSVAIIEGMDVVLSLWMTSFNAYGNNQNSLFICFLSLDYNTNSYSFTSIAIEVFFFLLSFYLSTSS